MKRKPGILKNKIISIFLASVLLTGGMVQPAYGYGIEKQSKKVTDENILDIDTTSLPVTKEVDIWSDTEIVAELDTDAEAVSLPEVDTEVVTGPDINLEAADMLEQENKMCIVPIVNIRTYGRYLYADVSLSEEDKSILEEKEVESFSVKIVAVEKYPRDGNNTYECEVLLTRHDGYLGSSTFQREEPFGNEVHFIYGGTFDITVKKDAISDWDTYYEETLPEPFLMPGSSLKGSLSVGERNHEYYVSVVLEDGAIEGETYEGNIYYRIVNEDRYEIIGVRSQTFSIDNAFTCDFYLGQGVSLGDTLEIWCVVYTDTSMENNYSMLVGKTEFKTGEIGDVVNVSVSDVTYTTAIVTVKILDFDYFGMEAFGADKLEVQVNASGSYWSSNALTGTATKTDPDIEIPLCDMVPGKKYEISVSCRPIKGESYGDSTNVNTHVTFTTEVAPVEFEPFTGIKHPTRQEIANEFMRLSIDTGREDVYERNVDHVKGGVLDDATLQGCTDLLNFIRFTAGIPSDLIYDRGCSNFANAGSEIDRIIDELTHTPRKPDSVSQDFYLRGYMGTTSSNLGKGYSSVSNAIISGWMKDYGDKNIGNGHRNHFMHPEYTIVGFGKSDNYSGAFVINGPNNDRERKVSEPYVYTWPAENTPIEILDDSKVVGWGCDYSTSIYLSEGYSCSDYSKVSVNVQNKTSGKSWSLSNDDTYYKNKDCYVSLETRGIIFQVDPYKNGDEISVHVDGYQLNGVDTPIDCNISIFSISDMETEKIPVTDIKINSATDKVCEGDSLNLSAKIIPENATNRKVRWLVESVDGRGQAQINSSGKLYAQTEGVVKVTAVSEDNSLISDSINIKISKMDIPVESMKLNKTELTLEKGDTYFLRPAILPLNATSQIVEYFSSEPDKITVDENGCIRAIDYVTEPVRITAISGSISANCLVNCEKGEGAYDRLYITRATSVCISGNNILMPSEETILKLHPVTTGEELTKEEYTVEYSVTGNVATVEEIATDDPADQDRWFRVKALSSGSTNIVFTVKTKVEGSSTIETVKKKVKITVLKSEEQIECGGEVVALRGTSLVLNQNLNDGVKLDLRTEEGTVVTQSPILNSVDGSHRYFQVTKIGQDYFLNTIEKIPAKTYGLEVGINVSGQLITYRIKVKVINTFPKIMITQNRKIDLSNSSDEVAFELTGNKEIRGVTFAHKDDSFIMKSAEPDCRTIGMDNESFVKWNAVVKRNVANVATDLNGKFGILYEGYRYPANVKIKIKAKINVRVSANTLIVDHSKITINKSKGDRSVVISTYLKNSSSHFPNSILLSGLDEKGKKVLSEKKLFTCYDYRNGKVKVIADPSIEAGTYKFTLSSYCEERGAIIKSSSVPVTLGVTEKNPTLSISSKGKINLINRSASYILLTPSLKNGVGKIQNVSIDRESKKLFTTRVVDGKIRVYARNKASIYPNTVYDLSFSVEYDNGMIFEDKHVRIKPTQTALKAASSKKVVIYKKQQEIIPLELKVTSPVGAKIGSVKVVNIPNGMEIVSEGEDYYLRILDREKLRPNKTESVILSVNPDGAYRTIKPKIVKIKAIIR